MCQACDEAMENQFEDEDEELEEDECPDCGRVDCDGAYGDPCNEDLEEEEEECTFCGTIDCAGYPGCDCMSVCAICDDSDCPGASMGTCKYLRVWQDGQRAKRNGRNQSVNPYKHGGVFGYDPDLSVYWDDGWLGIDQPTK